MDEFDPRELSRDELYQIAVQGNPEAHRWLPREVLELICLEEEVELPRRIVNKKRLEIMQHINARWTAVRNQVGCPAKSRDPEACFGCTDFQVTCCTLENRKLFHQED